MEIILYLGTAHGGPALPSGLPPKHMNVHCLHYSVANESIGLIHKVATYEASYADYIVQEHNKFPKIKTTQMTNRYTTTMASL